MNQNKNETHLFTKDEMISFHIEVVKSGVMLEGQEAWTAELEELVRETAENKYNELYK